MSWTCDEVLAVLGDEAQATAGGIIVLAVIEGEDGVKRPKHLKIGSFSGQSFILTDEGTKYLADKSVPKTAKPKGVSRAKPVEPSLDDLVLE